MVEASHCETGRFVAHSELRESQREMIIDGVETLSASGFQLAAAPTGIGKTAAALASVLEVARSSPNSTKILFLTGRQSQHRIVIDTVQAINSRLSDAISPVKVVDLIGRESMCEYVDRSTGICTCEEDVIESTRAERRKELRDMILAKPIHVDDVISRSRKRKMCAWATARSAVRDCDILVCDYNHVFVDGVRESSLPAMGIDLSETILIIDEAHNLPDRIRNGLERRATLNIFRDARFEMEEHLGNKEKEAKRLDLDDEFDSLGIESIRSSKRMMERLGKEMRKWYSEKVRSLDREKNDDMRIETSDFLGRINEILMESLDAENSGDYKMLRRLINDLYKVKVDFDDEIDEAEKETASYRLASMLSICLEYEKDPALVLVFDMLAEEGRVRSFLLDPGVVSEDIFSTTKGSILMSGTLFPPSMYADLLRLPKERKILSREYESPFLSDHRPVLVASDVTTKYSERSQNNTDLIRDHICALIEETPGHVALFVPSYAMLQSILDDGSWLPFGISIKEETPKMSKRLVNGTVDYLLGQRRLGKRVLLAGVLSGKLAEGVDYPQNVLDAVACVGLPLPPPSARQDALKNYYTERFGNNLAWKYTSFQPAVNSLMQALGRPIRKAEDRAIVLLLEKRLFDRRYRACMPENMAFMRSQDSARTRRLASRFFKQKPDPAIQTE